jgi:insulysin
LREIELPAGADFIFKSEHKTHLSSCAAVLFQTGVQGLRENVVVELLEHIANEPCFNQLRTKEQLGYIVFTGVRRSQGTQGIQVLVQSDRHPAFVESRIDSFLNDFEKLLETMTDEEFLHHRGALSVRKAEKPKKLIDRGNLVWAELSQQQYNFEKQKNELAELDTVTLDDIRKYYYEVLAPTATKRKRLTVHVVSMVEGGAGKKVNEVNGDQPEEREREEIVDVVNWKKQRGLYPSGKHYIIPGCVGGSGSKSKL